MQDPEQIIESLQAMTPEQLHHVVESVRQVQIERAVMAGDLDAVIAKVPGHRGHPGGRRHGARRGHRTARTGGHAVEHVVSYEVRNGEVVEVSQRDVAGKNMR